MLPLTTSLPALASFYPPKGTICGNKVLELTLLDQLVSLTANIWQSPEGKHVPAAPQRLSPLPHPAVVPHLGSDQPCRKPSEHTLFPAAFVFGWAAGGYNIRLESSGNHSLQQLGTAKTSLFLFVYLKAKTEGPRPSRGGCSTWGLISSMCHGCRASALQLLHGTRK